MFQYRSQASIVGCMQHRVSLGTSHYLCGGKNHGVGQAYFLQKRGGPKETFTMVDQSRLLRLLTWLIA